MSQITRCPSCATLFKVVPDQLRISDGWVRCGQCKKVFDATLSLQDFQIPGPQPGLSAEPLETSPAGAGADNAWVASDPEMPPAASGSDANGAEEHTVEAGHSSGPPAHVAFDDLERFVEDAAESDVPALVQDEYPLHGQEAAGYELPAALLGDTDGAWTPDDSEPETQVFEALHTAQSAGGSGSTAETVENPLFSPVFTTESSPDGATASKHDDSAANGLDGDDNAPLPGTDTAEARAITSASGLPEEVPATGAIDVAEVLVEEPAQPARPAAQEPSFVRSARRKALWGTPAVRLVLGAVVVLLAAVLLVQVAVQQRHYLASVQPQWRSALEALCVPLQCAVRPYQQIASVVVDSSSFNRLRGNTYRFALALKNQSALALALPAVELTLTDTSDQPVLRRVITPLELSAPATLPSGGEWMGSVEMDIDLGGDARISGYRVLVFYP